MRIKDLCSLRLFKSLNGSDGALIASLLKTFQVNDSKIAGMLSKNKYNLNAMAHDATIDLLKYVTTNSNVSEIYIDTVGPADKYQEKLQAIFPNQKIVVAKKADSIYPIVSAASICAKVTRDELLHNWQCIEGIPVNNLGSGCSFA